MYGELSFVKHLGGGVWREGFRGVQVTEVAVV